MKEPPQRHYYAHQCPETKRWFLCREGDDNNLCECFEWGGKSAERCGPGG